MNRLHLYVLAAVLVVAGLGLFLYKAVVLGFPLAPDQAADVWTVQARFTIEARQGPVRAVLQIPDDPDGFTILDENFVSRGYGLDLRDRPGGREAVWTIRRAAGRQTLYYRAVVVPGHTTRARTPPPAPPSSPDLEEPYQTAVESLAADIYRRSADTASFTAGLLRRLNAEDPGESAALLLEQGRSVGRVASLARTTLAAAEIPSRVVYGLTLADRQRYATFEPRLQVWDGDRWLSFHPRSGEQGLSESFFVWWWGERPLIHVSGAANPEVEVSVWQNVADALAIAEQRADVARSPVVRYSLLRLPVQTQAVYSVMLLVPVGALIMVLLRNVVGVKTFGTFMPILVALAFRETRLLAGVFLFILVMALGLALRFYLERLRLLLVPRLAAVLILVVLLIAAISVLSNTMEMESGLSVALFPLVILAMAIERMSIVWEERGPSEAVQEGLGTLAVAALAYLVMFLEWVEHLVFVFPELLLLVLAATLLLGRYRGFRLLELVRFRELARP
ncbi:MAG: UUP1 family membrane protein [Thermoanaerobaculia bacterium]